MEALREHHTMEEIARKYELHPTQMNQWKREAVSRLSQVFGKHEQDAKQEEEMKEKLYAQIGQLKVENDFLKKIALMPVADRYQMVDIQYDSLNLAGQCKLLDIPRSSFYYRRSMESDENLRLLRLMDEQYLKTPFYGIRRLKVWLQQLGDEVNRG